MQAKSASANDKGVKTLKLNNYNGKPVVETLTNGYFVVDEKWIVTYWNKAAEKLLNVSDKEIVGKNLCEHFAHHIPVEFYAVYQQAFARPGPNHFHEYWGEMGAWFDVITWFSDNTLSVSFKCSSLPIAVDTEERLKTLTELYKFVTEITNDCLWEWSPSTKEIFWIDGGHKRIFGYPIENSIVPESFWKNSIHVDDKARVLTSLQTIIGKELPLWECEYRFQKADGNFSHVHDRGHILYDEDGKANRIIGATRDITDRKIIEADIERQNQEHAAELTSAVIIAQENERDSIGKELHDNLGQILAVSKMYMEMSKRPDGSSEGYIDKSIGFIKQVLEEIRKISKKLVIPPAHILSLFDNIGVLIADITNVNALKIRFIHSGVLNDEIDEPLQVTLFRIIQEQLSNILKHAQATHAEISLTLHSTEIWLTIKDDGQGQLSENRSIGVGILNIKSRVAVHNGNVSIHSRRGDGFELRAKFPFNRTQLSDTEE